MSFDDYSFLIQYLIIVGLYILYLWICFSTGLSDNIEKVLCILIKLIYGLLKKIVRCFFGGFISVTNIFNPINYNKYKNI